MKIMGWARQFRKRGDLSLNMARRGAHDILCGLPAPVYTLPILYKNMNNSPQTHKQKKYYDSLGKGEFSDSNIYRSRATVKNIATAIYGMSGSLIGKKVLEVGFGRGDLIEMCPDFTEGLYIGVDLSLELLRNPKPNLSPYKRVSADAGELPFPDGVFDVVICNNVLHHVENPKAVVGEMQRVVKHDGFVIANEPNFLCLYQILHWIKNHDIEKRVWRFNRFYLKQLFQQTGLTDIKIVPVNILSTYFRSEQWDLLYAKAEGLRSCFPFNAFPMHYTIRGRRIA